METSLVWVTREDSRVHIFRKNTGRRLLVFHYWTQLRRGFILDLELERHSALLYWYLGAIPVCV